MASEQEKRALSASSDMEQSDEKRPKTTDEMPDWARTLLSEITHVRNNSNAMRQDLTELKHDLRGVKEEVDDLGARLMRVEVRQGVDGEKIKALEQENALLRERNTELKDENKNVNGRVDTLTDNSMRDTLTIHHLPLMQGKKETWDDTERLLAEFLSANTTQSVDAWLGKITRGHRGKSTSKSNVIHVLFRNWKWAQEVRELFRQKQGKINNIFCLDKFSINTQERRNYAHAKRDTYRKANPGTKLWIKYPATLMAKHVGEEKYTAIIKY